MRKGLSILLALVLVIGNSTSYKPPIPVIYIKIFSR